MYAYSKRVYAYSLPLFFLNKAVSAIEEKEFSVTLELFHNLLDSQILVQYRLKIVLKIDNFSYSFFTTFHS